MKVRREQAEALQGRLREHRGGWRLVSWRSETQGESGDLGKS